MSYIPPPPSSLILPKCPFAVLIEIALCWNYRRKWDELIFLEYLAFLSKHKLDLCIFLNNVVFPELNTVHKTVLGRVNEKRLEASLEKGPRTSSFKASV